MRMETQYLAIAIQYYIAGRSASFAYSLPVTGNLFHHAAEMLLKFILLDSYSGDQLKAKFGHNLKKLWREAKKMGNSPSLNTFDALISGLNAFEELRYPGKGYAVSISIFKGKPPKVSGKAMRRSKHYVICLEEIDEFVSVMLTEKRITPEWIKGLMLHGDAKSQYKRDNKHPFF